jgi:hypothetical protein
MLLHTRRAFIEALDREVAVATITRLTSDVATRRRRRPEEGRHEAGPRRRRRGAPAGVADEERTRRRARRRRWLVAELQEASDGGLPRLPVLHDGSVHQRYEAFHCYLSRSGERERERELVETRHCKQALSSARATNKPHTRML